MKKLLTLLLLCFASFIARSQYTPVIANYTISGKPIGYSQATPADGRSMVYDGTNFLYRPYRDSQEVISYLNLAKYRAGNVVYIVDSGGTLNGNGTYTNPHNTFWMFRDGVLDVNLIKLNWTTNSGTCSNCFITTTQLTDSSYKINRTNGTSDTIVIDFSAGVYITTLNNGLTLTGTNGQLGGPLTQNTTINGGGFDLAVSGNTFQQGQGAAITSANVITTGHDGNSFSVVGSTQINAITTTNWQAGSQIGFIFTGTPLLRNNQTATAGNAALSLAGGVDYTAATGDYIAFVYDGSVWHETARKLAGSVIPVTANNAITLTGANLQWGGTLLQNTTVAGNAFYTAFSGGRLESGAGLAVIAANDLVLGNDGNMFSITGTTQINAISTVNWQAGSQVSFVFTSIVTLKNNTAGGLNTAPMLLAGSVDYTSAVGDYIGFQYDGTNWHETNRKLAGATSSVTASNGLTATAGNVTLGGTLTNNTTISQSTFRMIWTGAVASGSLAQFTQSANGGGVNILNTGSGNTLNVTTNNGTGISVANTGTSYGITVSSTSTSSAGILSQTPFQGVQGITTNNVGTTNAAGVLGGSTGLGTPAMIGYVSVSSTNTVDPVLVVERQTTGVAANGIGESVDFKVSTDAGGYVLSNQIISKWTTAADATRTSQLSFTGVNSAANTTLITFAGNGQGTMTNTVPSAALFAVSNTEPTLNNFGISGTSINGTGVIGFSTGNDAVAGASTNGNGGNFTSTTGVGVQASSNSASNAAELVTLTPVTTNTVRTIATFYRNSSGGGGANGIGGAIELVSRSATGTAVGNTLISTLTDATGAAPTSQFSIKGNNASTAATTIWTLDGNGSVTTTGGKINRITTQAGGTYSIAVTDWTVVATGTTSTWTFPTLVTGQVWNLVNHGSGAITLSAAVTTANGVTSSSIAAGSTYQVQYDGSVLRKIN